MNKLVVCSFEGALIDEGDAIAYKTMLEIDRVRKHDNSFCVVSSKDLEFIMEYNKDFPFLDFIIAYNGSCVYDVKKNQFLFKKNIASTVVKRIVRLFCKNKIIIYTSKKKCGVESADFSDVLKIDIAGSNLKQANEIIDVLLDIGVKLNLKLDENRFVVEIISGSVSREKGVNFIVKEVNISNKNVFVIGSKLEDKFNIEKYAGVAVRNADVLVKSVAKYVSSEEDSKGVSELLEKFI